MKKIIAASGALTAHRNWPLDRIRIELPMQRLHVKKTVPTSRNRVRLPIELGLLFICSVLIALGGCKREEEIRHIVVDADRSGVEIATRSNSNPTASVVDAQPTDRMVVAIHTTSLNFWTFKISGPIAEVKRTEPQWMKFLRKVTFDDDGVPRWEIPEGWKQVEVGSSTSVRFATLKIADTLDMSVVRLPAPQDLQSNVTRWNGQLSLPPVGAFDLPKIGADSKVPFLMYDQVGSLGGGGGMMMPGGARPPMAGGRNPHAPNAPNVLEAGSVESPIEFEAPENWVAGTTSRMVPAKFQVGEGDSVARVTVTRMPRRRNTWEQVSANWAADIGMDLSGIDFDTETKEMEVGELPGKIISHISEDDEIAGAIIGIRVPREEEAWFVKIVGPKGLVSESKEEFIKFAKSIRFKGSESE